MSYPATRWVLAFDASCEQCRKISEAVEQACGGKVELLSLLNRDVHRWRVESLGEDAPWAPTLLKVGPDRVRAWVGPGMAVALVRRLGPRATVRTVGALSDLRRPSRTEDGPGRKQFLRLAGGAAVTAGLLIGAGRAAANAATADRDEAELWVEAHRDSLPQDYDAMIAHPLHHRQAIWAALPPATRSRLWVEHLTRYRRAHPGLSPEQSGVLEKVHRIAARESSFAFDRVDDPGPGERALREAAAQHFGREEANRLFATLGPAEPSGRRGAKALNCNCSVESNYCSSSACHDNQCMKGRCSCRVYQRSCGYLWRYPCDGFCACSSC
ncbi:bacteriocin fulvocin C-related protein [Streptomyces sp. NPDC059788]|uniref:bacteriocin fulvocin C-related protein n=1 Tax=Streptomyces sp. NPDC059788 TaxID=3346948 RepID=UPI00364E970A